MWSNKRIIHIIAEEIFNHKKVYGFNVKNCQKHQKVL